MEKRTFACNGNDDNIEIQEAIDWVTEDPENREALIIRV